MFKRSTRSVEDLKNKIQLLITNERMASGIRNATLYKLKEEIKEIINLQMKQILNKKIEFCRKQNIIKKFKSKKETRSEDILKENILQQKLILQKLKEEKELINKNKVSFLNQDKSFLKLKNYIVDQMLGYDIKVKIVQPGELILFIYSNYSSIDDYHIINFKNGQVISLQSSSETVKIDTRALSKYLQLKQYGRFFIEYTLLKAEQSTIKKSQDYDSEYDDY